MKSAQPESDLLPVRRESDEVAVATQQPSVAAMLQGVITTGVTAENVGAVEKLVALYERMEEKRAEREFTTAFNALQAEMPTIVASSVIPNRGKYERFEDIMRQIGPLLSKHGFAVSFEQEADDRRVKVKCNLRHVGGHSTQTAFSVRISGKADSETQADCKASTTAKRNALLQCLNIVIRQDVLSEEHDASIEGGEITKAQADELERRVAMLNADHKKFLAWLGVKSYAEIPSGKYDIADQFLRTKERGQ